MEKSACQFRMLKLNANKSQHGYPTEETSNPPVTPKKPIRLSEQGARPVGLTAMNELVREMPNPFDNESLDNP